MIPTDIISQLTRDEGFRDSPYTDTTGHSTVGIGHNLVSDPLPGETYPMTLARAQTLLQGDLQAIQLHLCDNLPWVAQIDTTRYGVLENVGFNVGVAGLLQFHNTLHFMETGDWQSASTALLSSLAARELPERYGRLAQQLITGTWQ